MNKSRAARIKAIKKAIGSNADRDIYIVANSCLPKLYRMTVKEATQIIRAIR